MSQQFGSPKPKAVAPIEVETAASIKQKYESNTNTNAFTDAEKSKLTNLSSIPNAVVNQKGGMPLKLWLGTQAEYDAIIPKAADVVYMVQS